MWCDGCWSVLIFALIFVLSFLIFVLSFLRCCFVVFVDKDMYLCILKLEKKECDVVSNKVGIVMTLLWPFLGLHVVCCSPLVLTRLLITLCGPQQITTTTTPQKYPFDNTFKDKIHLFGKNDFFCPSFCCFVIVSALPWSF